MTKTAKKKGWSKCFICTHSYKTEEIDEHMNGITHHHVLEELYKKSRPHHCLVCGCVWNGLTLYRQHVGTAEHKKKIAALVKSRRSGTQVSLNYTIPPDLITLCRERDRLSVENKAKRKQDKLMARKAKQRASASRNAQPNTTQGQHPYQHHQQNKENKNSSTSQSRDSELRGNSSSPAPSSSSFSRERDWHVLHQEVSSSQADESSGGLADSAHGSEGLHAHSTIGSKEQGGCAVQSGGSGSRPSAGQFFSEIDFSQDFTSDLLPPVGALLFAPSPVAKAGPSKGKEDEVSTLNGALSKETAGIKQKKLPHGKKSRKRPLNPSKGPPSTPTEQNCQEDHPRAPGLVKAHVQHISTILRRIRKSLDEEGLANLQAASTSTTDDAYKRVPKKLKTTHHEDGHDNNKGGTGDGEVSATAHSDCRESPDHMQSPCSSSITSSAGAVQSAGGSGGGGTGSVDPALSRPGLPELLKRDLSRLGAKSSSHHEPNLTAARRVRTISSSQVSAGGEAEKEAAAGLGLKPTLQKLINSTAAKRKVNWKELYQEYNRKKRLREKGMPRFGIELVSPVVPLPDDLELEEVQDLPLGEDFQWDSIDFDSIDSPAGAEEPASEDTSSVPFAGQVDKDAGQHRPAEVCVKIEKDSWGHSDLQGVRSPAESTCQCNEDPSRPEQAKPKKERQVDELLAVSLREEELSSSLLNLEDSLTQARSALQEAYVKVQHLLVVREQTSNDINALRAKRIKILKIMRGGGSSGDGEKPIAKASREESAQPPRSSPPSVSPAPPPEPPHGAGQPAASSEGSAQAPVPIKEEPISPTFGPGSP